MTSRLLFGMAHLMKTNNDRVALTPRLKPRSGLYVFSDGPSGPTSVSMKTAKDIAPFVERLLSIGRKNVRVGDGIEAAVSYDDWKVGVSQTVE